MGQKVNPIGIRLGISRDWSSRWYADTKNFAGLVNSDHKIRKLIRKRLSQASVSKIYIERPASKVHVTIHTARPGIVIGKKGEDIEKMRREVATMLGMPLGEVRINIAEIRKPELDAHAPELTLTDWLPQGPFELGITAGASTPNNKVGEAVLRVLAILGIDVEPDTPQG